MPTSRASLDSLVEDDPLLRSQHLADLCLVQRKLDSPGAEGIGPICCFGLNIRGVFRVGQERRVQRFLSYLCFCPCRTKTLAIFLTDLF